MRQEPVTAQQASQHHWYPVDPEPQILLLFPLPRSSPLLNRTPEYLSPPRMLKNAAGKAAASEEARRISVLYVEPLSDARTTLDGFFNIPPDAAEAYHTYGGPASDAGSLKQPGNQV